MSNIEIWCKAFLSIYPLLSSITDSIDRLVLKRAICSKDCLPNTVVKQSDSLIKLSQYKIDLINLKILTDQTLAQMDESSVKYLVSRYIDKIDCKQAIEMFGVPRSSFYRNLNLAFSKFKKIFLQKANQLESVNGEIASPLWQSILSKIYAYNSLCDETMPPQSELLCSLILKQLRKMV